MPTAYWPIWPHWFRAIPLSLAPLLAATDNYSRLQAHDSCYLFDLNRRRQQIPHTDEVVSGCRNRGYDATRSRPADRIHPSEDLFDALAFSLTHFITGVAGGAGVDRTSAGPSLVLRDVRRYIHPTHFLYEVFGIVRFVGGQRDSMTSLHAFCQYHPCISLRRSAALLHFRVHHQTVAILHEPIAAVCQFRFMPSTFASQSCIRIGRRLVRIVTTLLAAKIDARNTGII